MVERITAATTDIAPENTAPATATTASLGEPPSARRSMRQIAPMNQRKGRAASALR